jgi:phospholipase D1/2
MSKEKGLKKIFHPFDHRVSEKVEEIEQKLEHTKLRGAHIKAVHLKHKVGKFTNLFNANHRHDEAHEKATDAKRSKIAESHRFNSFAPERDGNLVKWYVDGRDYFWAVAEALEKAQETIYIADWWLSPELFLKRPPFYNQQHRLDQVLKRRAQAGVKIYISVYKEVSMNMAAARSAAHSSYRFLLPSPATVNIPRRRSWVSSKRASLAMETSELCATLTTMSLRMPRT